jgi:hypothetical protein
MKWAILAICTCFLVVYSCSGYITYKLERELELLKIVSGNYQACMDAGNIHEYCMDSISKFNYQYITQAK